MLSRLRTVIHDSGQSPKRLLLAPAISMVASVLEIVSLVLLAPMIQLLMGGEMSLNSSVSIFGRSIALGPLLAEGESRRSVFSILLLIFALASLGRPLLEFCANVVLGRFIRDFIGGVRRKIFGNFLSYGKLYFDERGIGALSASILQLSNEIAISLAQSKSQISSLFLGVGYVIIMLQVSWKLALLSFLFVPAIGLIQRAIGKRIENASFQSSKQLSTLTQKVTDVLRCMTLVKTSNQGQEEVIRFNDISRGWGQIEYGIGKKYNFNGMLNEFCTIGVGLFLIGVSSFLFQRRGADFGPQFIIFFLAFKRFFGSLASYGSIRMNFMSVKGSLERVHEVMTFRPEYVVSSGNQVFSGKFSQIDIRNVTFCYGDRPALNRLNMSFRCGEVTGIVGASGSGKSSLLTLLNRLYDYQSGEILIDGVDLRQFSIASLRKNIGYISQETYVFNDSLRCNLSYGIEVSPSDGELIAALRRATLGPLFASLLKGLDTVLGENGVLLSGGERQRLAIARNLLRDPAILFLDEATSALDSSTEAEVQEALEDLSQSRTTIVVAHRLSTIAAAPVVYTMSEGRVIACQTGAEIAGKVKSKSLLAS